MDLWSWTILTVACVCVVAALISIYLKLTRARCNCQVDLSGKTAIVTGANTGIGYYTALDFAARNARVILACRDEKKAVDACRRIQEETGNKNVVVRKVDLSSLKSVRYFVEEALKIEKRLDILVNNAGVIGSEKRITAEGLESTFATNHFGPFLLTNLLLDLMKKSGRSRVITVSSLVNKIGKIRFDNLRSEMQFRRYQNYQDSKLANILFTKELARRLQGTGVTANVLHPGTIQTDLLRDMPSIVRGVAYLFGILFMKSAEEGAQTSIHCAVSEDLASISGRYFCDCRDADNTVNTVAHDEGLAKKLWEISEKYTDLGGN